MVRHWRTKAARGLAAGLLLVGVGCTVGPDYQGPPEAVRTGPAFQRTASQTRAADPLVGPWWQSLNDPELDRLVRAALVASPDLDAARARLRQSRADLRLQNANLLPSTGTSAVYLHSHTGGSGLAGPGGRGGLIPSDVDLYDIGFDASWEVDLFGGQRRAIESAVAAAEAREADLADTQVSLTAEVAGAYVSLRDLQHRLELARSSALLQGRMLGLLQLRATGGTASPLDVERLTTQVESTRADLVPLQAQIERQLNRLAVLTGQAPGTLDRELAAASVLPRPPETVTIGDPAGMLRRRPDIRVAERRIAAENALIGQREADLFPKLTLLGNIGFGSTDIGKVLTGGSFAALGGPILQWKPFDFGRTRARITQAEAARDEALAQYRGAILKALDDAETALSRFGRRRESVASLARVKTSADRAAAMTRIRFEGGTATLIDTLDTERQRLQAEQALAQAEAELTQDFIGLQKSLGLGWGAS